MAVDGAVICSFLFVYKALPADIIPRVLPLKGDRVRFQPNDFVLLHSHRLCELWFGNDLLGMLSLDATSTSFQLQAPAVNTSTFMTVSLRCTGLPAAIDLGHVEYVAPSKVIPHTPIQCILLQTCVFEITISEPPRNVFNAKDLVLAAAGVTYDATSPQSQDNFFDLPRLNVRSSVFLHFCDQI
jgi:hypothetical protein